jgi:hypothetical protein
MSQPDPPPGIPAFVKLRRRAFGQVPGMVPLAVRHAGRPLEWLVVQVLEEEWEGPELGAGEYGPDDPGAGVWYRLKVYGPLPGRLGGHGYLVMEVASFADRPGWWIAVGE